MADKKPSAEEIFRKNSEEMSDVERMMAEILNENKAGAYDSASDEKNGDFGEDTLYSSPAPPSRSSGTEQLTVDDTGSDYDPEYRSKTKKTRKKDTDQGYGQNYDQEYVHNQKDRSGRKKYGTRPKKKRGTVLLAILLILCAVIVIGAILIKTLSEDLPASFAGLGNTGTAVENLTASEEKLQDSDTPENTLAPDVVIPTPDGDGEHVKIVEPGTVVIYSGTSAPYGQSTEDADTTENGTVDNAGAGTESDPSAVQNTETREHSYTLCREDLSWTEAQQKCNKAGGHLVNIGNQEELDEIIALAETQGIEKIWIGCHRENAQLIWENDEQIDFYKWGKGEPSGYDSGDRVTEDYVLLWKFNGEWVYNDSRDDPVKDYPTMYSGQIGYVCEFGD